MTTGITVDQLEDGHALILGTTGSGKTYQLRGMLEQLRRADRRVGAVDKLGNHWGLTLAGDGSGPGLEFVIFGGKRAHIPMKPGDCARTAALFVERNIPAIFDVSQWHAEEQEEWVTGFAETVFRLNQEEALHLSFDEAQSWVPQGGGGDAFRAVRLLAEQGRGNGIRLLLSCQRLSRLDATVREMMHTVVVMRQTGVLDRDTVRKLISANAGEGKMLEAELPQLAVGTGFVWTAGGSALRRVAFSTNETFDSSRTPRHGDTPPSPIASASALVEELRAALAPPPVAAPSIPADAVAAYAVGAAAGELLIERDRRIAELEATVSRMRAIIGNARLDLSEIQNVAYRAIDLLTGSVDRTENVVDLHSGDANLQAATASPSETPQSDPVDVAAFAASAKMPRGAAIKIGGPPPPRAAAAERPAGTIRGLTALQALVSASPGNGLTEEQWAFLACFARTGGTWTTYKGALRAAGLIEQREGRWLPTRAGYLVAADAPIDPPTLGADLVRAWAKKGQSIGKLAEVLLKRWPHTTTRESLAADAGMTASGGTFTTYLGRLRKHGLLEERGKHLRLNPALMEWQ